MAYIANEGSNNEIISDSDETLATLDNSKLNVDINVSNYSDEIYTLNYIKNIFDNLTSTFDGCKKLIDTAKTYISNNASIADNIAQPELLDFDFSITGEISASTPITPTNSNLVSEAYVQLKDANSHLNLRAGAGVNTAKIGSLSNNTKLTVLEGESTNSNWIKVKTEDGTIGYVSVDYVSKVSPSSINVPPSTSSASVTSKTPIEPTLLGESSVNSSLSGIVNTKKTNLNLRSGPGTSNSVIGSLANGTNLEIVKYDKNSSWIKVKTEDGTIGYVSSKYLKVKES